ncbi:helix-turn-helix transcriptional regulator [Actinoplanes sp. URMC 104]|uniref:helix-turn-helix transcriptional regulator n=1 Tax=Actinoplanes sp. URMC 104 TaxID=3423409 RepID=UPI003F1D2354
MGPAPPPSPDEARRRQLADFLRTRRAALRPDTGDAGRRRTPGLRREEVAQRSGVGLSWYTWLEQGRDVSPSDQVLLALSRALELSPAEREHLFRLAGVAPPETAAGPVDEQTAALVEGLLPHPAFVLGPRFDVLAANRAAALVLAGLVAAPPEERNLLLWLFGGGWDETAEAWQQTAQANLLDFRAEFARHPGDPGFVALVDRLTSASGTFRTWWARHDVHALEPARKRIDHRELGPLTLLSVQSRPSHAPGLRLRILVPGDDRTRKALG